MVTLQLNKLMLIDKSNYIESLEKELKDLKEQNASQQGMFDMTTVYLKKIQRELKISEQQLFEANKHLTDSIQYAKRIQDAFLVQKNALEKIVPESFIFQKPKDIVSGDFLWAHKNGSDVYIAAGDCTGHGVPGAMLSIFVISMLNLIINDYQPESPAFIIEKLDQLMLKYLTQYDDQIRDSAEISLIKLNTKKNTLQFCGARRPLIRVRGKNIKVFKGGKLILDNFENKINDAINQTIDIQKGDAIYMFSDGFVDQFGRENNRKFMSKRLLASFQEIASNTVADQHSDLANIFDKWKGANEQVDDVLVLGIKI